MAQSMVNLKVFNKIVSEARRFSIDEAVCSNFMFINEKVQLMFPSLRGTNFKITWKDNDGDFITVTGDEDLMTAFTEMTGTTKVLYIENGADQSKAAHCPLGETFDVHALGEIARQYLEPIVGSLSGSAPSASGEAKVQTQAFMDMLRNAAHGFFGEYAENKPESKTENSNSEQKPSESGQAQNEHGSGEQKSSGSEQTPQVDKPQPSVNPKIAEGLAQLQEMGFNNDNGFLKKLLEYLDGNVESVVRILANK